ncbi:MAG: hypothetical protein SFU27_04565 [Thermonemataceae bacterium]|nr:hypothetical protein [Thermonemataceae bacterium]
MQFFRNILHWLKELLIGEEQSDFRAMVWSVAFALLFWVFHTLNAEHSHQISIPVTLQKDGNVEVYVPKEIDCTIWGTGWKIAKYYLQKPKRSPIYCRVAPNKNFILADSLKNQLSEKLEKGLIITSIKKDTLFCSPKNAKR